MRIYVKLAPRPRLLMTQPGDSIGGLPIGYTHPGEPEAMIDTPDDWDAQRVQAWVAGLQQAGLLADDEPEQGRPEKQIPILGEVVPLAAVLWAPGDTFAGLGIDEATQARGNWGRGVKVALLDTGLDGTHHWFSVMRQEGRLTGDLTDSHGHGTHCGGTIAGEMGVAPGVHLRVWNVLPGGSGSESGIASGIDQAVAWGAQVISMSLGGAGASAIINGATTRARQAGVLVSSAAGNGSSVGPVGSPAMASSFCVLAYDRSDPARYATFSDGRHPSDANLPRVARPGVEVVSAKPGGGTQPMSGTSMACPHATGYAALLLGAGMSGAEVELYTWRHMGGLPGGLTAKLLPDFGAGEGPPPDPPPSPPDELEQARSEMDQVIALQDDARYVNRDADPDFAWSQIGEASRITAIARERLAPKVLPPPVEPPPSPGPSLGAVFGTYSGHGAAVDAYPGRTEDEVNWGPHHGHPIIAPADGRVEVYAFGTPLDVLAALPLPMSDAAWTAYRANWQALAEGWVCRVDPFQTMYVAVWYPDAPYFVAGIRCGHLHYGHVHQNIKAGAVRKNDLITVTWDSGVRFEPGNPVARCAHVHCCAGAGTTLSPNGDLPGRLAAIAQGWAPLRELASVPGPNEYLVPNLYCARRRLTDFITAGRQPPPMPS